MGDPLDGTTEYDVCSRCGAVREDFDVRQLRADLAAMTARAEKAEAIVHDEWTCGAMRSGRQTHIGCGKDLTFRQTPGVDWNEGKDDTRVAIRCLDCGVVMCPICARAHFAGHVTDLAAALAVERDKVAFLKAIVSGNNDRLLTNAAARERAERDRRSARGRRAGLLGRRG